VKQITLRLIALSLLLAGCGTTTGEPPPDPGITIYEAVPSGSIVITEIQAHPNSARPQFLEFLVVGTEAINLKGCQLVDSGTQEHRFSVAEDLLVEPGTWFLAAEESDLGVPEDPEGPEQLPVTLLWEGMSLSPIDPTEAISLNCPDGTGARHVIDEVAFDWDSLSIRQGHSWQLEGPADADTNDDPTSWCVAPSSTDAVYAVIDGMPDYGSPLAESSCQALDGQPVSAEGQLVINEILIDDFSGLREWFEIYNPGTEDRELDGCELGDASAAEPENSQTHVMDKDQGETVVAAGGYLLLSKGGFDITTGAGTLAHYSYSSIIFNNSEDQLLWIDCPVENEASPIRVDSITYVRSPFGSELKGRSLLLDPASADAVSNDLSESWCLASVGEAYWSNGKGEDLNEAWGTPGSANDPCPVPSPSPLSGEFVFTEILAHSAGSSIGHNEEWIELRNLSDQTLSLDGCLLVNEDSNGIVEHRIEPVFGLEVAANEYVVMVRSGAEDSIACGLPHDYSYSNINFNNTDPEQLSLLCGLEDDQVLVDSISFDGGLEGFEAGMPRQLRNSAEDQILNNYASNWCVIGAPETFPWSCSVEDDTNYGTPGSASNCP